MGKIADQIDKILNPHFKMEEEHAFPPLTLMAPRSRGEIDLEMKDALERLKEKNRVNAVW